MRPKTIAIMLAISVAVLLGLAYATSGPYSSWQGMHGMHSHQGTMNHMNQGQMMSHYQEMLSQMKASDEKLNTLTDQLQTAKSNDQKIEIMQKMLGELVQNRSQMREQMMSMIPQMMEQMAGQMQVGQDGEGNSMGSGQMMNGQNY